MQTLSEIRHRVIGSRPSGGLLDVALEISERVDQALLEQGVGIRRVHSVQDLFEVIQSDLRGGMKNRRLPHIAEAEDLREPLA